MMAEEGDVGGSVGMRVSALVIESGTCFRCTVQLLLSAVHEGIALN